MRKETEKKIYCNIENNEKWRPQFLIMWKAYWTISWYIKDVQKEKKKITPKKWLSAGKEIMIYNLLIDVVDAEWDFQLQMPLYSSITRNVLNSLAWPDPLDEVFFSIYNNKQWFRSISIKKSDSQDRENPDYYPWKYTFDEINAMLEIKKEKWEDKKDYDWLTDKLLEELLPIIHKKLDIVAKLEDKEEPEEKVKKPADEPDIPF